MKIYIVVYIGVSYNHIEIDIVQAFYFKQNAVEYINNSTAQEGKYTIKEVELEVK